MAVTVVVVIMMVTITDCGGGGGGYDNELFDLVINFLNKTIIKMTICRQKEGKTGNKK